MPFRFRISGVVREQGSGRALANLLVRAFDQDLLMDDALGSTTTDAEGRFEIQFTELAFQDAVETRPDVYLRVYDPDGHRVLAHTRNAVRRNARAEEHFEIEVPAGSAPA